MTVVLEGGVFRREYRTKIQELPCGLEVETCSLCDFRIPISMANQLSFQRHFFLRHAYFERVEMVAFPKCGLARNPPRGNRIFPVFLGTTVTDQIIEQLQRDGEDIENENSCTFAYIGLNHFPLRQHFYICGRCNFLTLENEDVKKHLIIRHATFKSDRISENTVQSIKIYPYGR